jgi:hypothetical protein
LVFHTNRTNIEGVSEQGTVGNIWTYEGEVVGGWGRLHNEKLLNLYISPNIIRVIKSILGIFFKLARELKCKTQAQI